MAAVESIEKRVQLSWRNFVIIVGFLLTTAVSITFTATSIYFIIQSNQSHVAEIELHIEAIKTEHAEEEEEMKALIVAAENRVGGRLDRITGRQQGEIDALNALRDKYQLKE